MYINIYNQYISTYQRNPIVRAIKLTDQHIENKYAPNHPDRTTDNKLLIHGPKYYKATSHKAWNTLAH